jgi:hypothetical protein
MGDAGTGEGSAGDRAPATDCGDEETASRASNLPRLDSASANACFDSFASAGGGPDAGFSAASSWVAGFSTAAILAA